MVKPLSALSFNTNVSNTSCFLEFSIGKCPVIVSINLDRSSNESTVETISGGILLVILI